MILDISYSMYINFMLYRLQHVLYLDTEFLHNRGRLNALNRTEPNRTFNINPIYMYGLHDIHLQ